MRRVVVWPLIVVAVAALLWVATALTQEDDRPRAGSRLRVLFTGEALGELEPCNCSGKDAGGLPALGGFLDKQEGDHVLVDVGCLGRGARDFEVLRLQAVLRGMAEMRYDAANIGEYELWLGKDELARQFALGVPFVSANVTDEKGEPAAKPFLVVEKAGLKIAVTGLVASGRYLTGPGLKVDDPKEALARIMPAIRQQAGVIIVLADLGLEAVRELVGDFPEISLVLFRGRWDSRPPERVNRTIIASVSGKVRFVGDVKLSWGEDMTLTAKGRPVLLDQRFKPSKPVAHASIEWYKRSIRGKRFDLAQPRPGWRRLAPVKARAGDKYAGSAACRACHVVSCVVWEKSKHARAIAALEKAGYDYSPECVVCHVVGYGAADGYATKKDTPGLANVGCESCHGRGGRHVHSRGKHIGSIVRSGERECLACHTPEHSRGFVFAKTWPKIAHKEPPRELQRELRASRR